MKGFGRQVDRVGQGHSTKAPFAATSTNDGIAWEEPFIKEMSDKRLHQVNKAAWEVTAAKYEEEEAGDIALLRGGGNNLLAPERRFLQDLGSWCRRAVHLQCSGGLDTLSLWRQGVAEMVGIDISERMIASARRKSEALGAPATWYCCDVLESPHELDGSADLVYTGRGALCWMMDIRAWARVVARLLKPGGRLYLFEGHPLDWVWDTEAETFQFHPEHGYYFSEALDGECWPAPFIERSALPSGGTRLAKEERPAVRARQWTLGPVMNSLVEAGLALERFEEHPELYWNQFEQVPAELAARLPHTYSLLMRKL
jgi:SAM-dependent methyltransferase